MFLLKLKHFLFFFMGTTWKGLRFAKLWYQRQSAWMTSYESLEHMNIDFLWILVAACFLSLVNLSAVRQGYWPLDMLEKSHFWHFYIVMIFISVKISVHRLYQGVLITYTFSQISLLVVADTFNVGAYL